MSTTLELPPQATPPQTPSATPPAPAQVQPPRRDAFRRVTRAIPPGRLTPTRLLSAVLLLTFGIVVCVDAWREIFAEYAWGNDDYTHIFVVPFVAALLVYVRRLRLRHYQVNGTLVGPLIVATGMSMMFAGYQVGRQAMFHLGAVMIAVGCVVSVLGKGAIFRFLPAVVVLGFLVPFPGEWKLRVGILLQDWTAQISHVLLSAIGFPTQVTGYTLAVNGRPIVIAEACNGMRSVFMLLLLAYAFAFALPLRNGVRVALLLASPFVTLLCNVIRALPTILFYGYAPDWFEDPQKGLWVADQFHWVAGYGMYVLSFVLWLGIMWLMRWTMLPIQRYTLASQ